MSIPPEDKTVQEWKTTEVAELSDLLAKYDTIALAPLEKIRAIQIQELRKKLRGTVILRCSKNRFFKRALNAVGDKKLNMESFGEQAVGSNLLVFTNLDPFKLSMLFDKSKVKLSAKAGDIAPNDIVVPEGNTGLPPGPVISEFSELGIRTRIESGAVWVSRDSVVAKKGDSISNNVASMLSRLGIKPIEAGMTITAAYQGGVLYPYEALKLDVDAFKSELQSACGAALSLAIAGGIFTDEAMPFILAKAYNESVILSEAVNLEAEVAPRQLAKAYQQMSVLLKLLAEKDKNLSS